MVKRPAAAMGLGLKEEKEHLPRRKAASAMFFDKLSVISYPLSGWLLLAKFLD